MVDGGDIKINITVDSEDAQESLEEFQDGLKDTASAGNRADDALSNFQTSMLALGAAVGVGVAALGTLKAASDITFQNLDRARELEGLRAGFEDLQGGAAQADVSLNNLRQTTEGLVSDFELIQQANQALLLGLSPEQFDQIAAAAIKLARAAGIDAAQGINDLTAGLAKGSPELLNNLGIVVKAEQAYKELAEALGVEVDALTEEQKARAVQVIGLEQALEKASQLNDVQDSAAQTNQRLGATIQNMADRFALAISQSDGLSESIDGFSTALKNIDIEQIAVQIARLTSLFLDLATTAINAGNAILRTFGIGDEASLRENLGVLGDQGRALTEEITALNAQTKITADQFDAVAQSAGAAIAEIQRTKGFGLSFEGANRAINELDSALNALAARVLPETSKATEELSTRQERLKKAFEGSTGAVGKSKKAQDEAKKSAENFRKEIQRLDDAIDDLTGNRSAGTTALTNEIAELIEELETGETSSQDVATALGELREETVKNSADAKEFAIALREGAAAGKEAAKQLEELEEIAEGVLESAADSAEDLAERVRGLGGELAGILGLSATTGKVFTDIFEGFVTGEGKGIAGQFGDILGDAFDGIFGEGATGAIGQFSPLIGAAFEVGGLISDALEQDTSSLFAEKGIDAAKDDVARQLADIGRVVGDALGTIFFGIPIGTILDEIGILEITGGIKADILASFGFLGSQNPGTVARRGVTDFLNRAFDQAGLELIIGGQLQDIFSLSRPSELFTDTLASFDEILNLDTELGQRQFEGFEGVSQALTRVFGVQGEIGGEQIGLILAANLENLNNLQIALQAAGVTGEQMGEALRQAFLAGDIKAGDFLRAMDQTQKVLAQGIPDAVGAVDVALNNLIVGGAENGRIALDALGDLAVEAGERGVQTLEGLRQELLASGADASKVEALFNAIAAAGITSLDDLANVSIDSTALIVANLENVDGFFAETAEKVSELRAQLDAVTDKTVNIRLNVTTTFDENTERAINEGIVDANDLPAEGQGFAE